MPYAERQFECAGCGAPTIRRAPAGAEVRCIHCSIERAVTNMRQLRSRSGEFYQRWARGMARAAAEAEVIADLGDQIDRIGLPTLRVPEGTSPPPSGCFDLGFLPQSGVEGTC